MAKPANKMSTVSLITRTFQEWSNDEAPKLGASLAFYSMLSIGPLLLIAVSVTGLIISHDQAGRYIIEQIRGLVGADGAKALEAVIDHAQSQKQGILATAIGLITLLISAAGFFSQLQSALNTIFNAPKVKTGIGTFIKQRLLSFGMVVGICLLLLSSLVISATLAAITGLFGTSAPAFLLQIGNVAASLVISTLLFAVTFKVMPDVQLRWRDVWLGAIITAILFAIGKSLIGLYLGRSSFASTYGAAGSLIVLLVWVYYSAQIIFFGAEFTQVYAEASGRTFTLKPGFKPRPAEASDSRVSAANGPGVKAVESVDGPPSEVTTRSPEKDGGLFQAAITLIAFAGILVALRPTPRPR